MRVTIILVLLIGSGGWSRGPGASLWPLQVLADDEDPLRYTTGTHARNKSLEDVLQRIQYEDPPAEYGRIEARPCEHSQLQELLVPLEQVLKFKDGVQSALRVTNLLNVLYLSLPSTDQIIVQQPRHRNRRNITSNNITPSGTFGTTSSRSSSVLHYSTDVIEALVRDTLETQENIISLGVAFVRGHYYLTSHRDAPASSSANTSLQLFGLLAWRNMHGRIVVGNIANIYDNKYDDAEHPGTRWFTELLYRSPSRKLDSNGPMNLKLTTADDGYWEQRPTLDCGASNKWVMAHSLPFFVRNDSSTAVLKGVVLSTHPLREVDINQCDSPGEMTHGPPFAGTHNCPSFMLCQARAGSGFTRGGYICHCMPGYHLPNSSVQYYLGVDVELNTNLTTGCIPCPEGCPNCSGGGPMVCLSKRQRLLKSVPLVLQVASLILTATFALIITKRRKCPVIVGSMWSMLLSMMLGAILIYSTVLVRAMEPSALSCVGEQWFRESGFTLYYGAVVLKLYRSLVQHRTRRAHRIVIRDVDLLKYLAGLLTFVAGYLSAGSAMAVQLSTEGRSLLEVGRTGTGHTFKVCQVLWWEYVTEAGELCFILFGMYLAFQLRGASGRFIASLGGRCNLSKEYVASAIERRALTVALFLELLVSCALYTARHVHVLVATIHPDHVFLAYFIRTHVTVTASMMLIIGPKLFCRPQHYDGHSESQPVGEGGSTELHLCEQLANGDVEISDLNISQMDPEEIRGEMRRVYTQLEELRARTMTLDNPHISKKRRGRKPTHRRFSLTNRKGSKDKSAHRHRGTTAMDTLEVENRTPEDSVCSIEAPSGMSVYGDGPSTLSDTNVQISYKI